MFQQNPLKRKLDFQFKCPAFTISINYYSQFKQNQDELQRKTL